MANQLFGDDSTTRRLPVYLLLDFSGSMSGAPIAALNEGLKACRDDLVRDALACRPRKESRARRRTTTESALLQTAASANGLRPIGRLLAP